MTSILFPETLHSGFINSFPSKLSAISYNYSGDAIILRAHMKDRFRRLQQDGDIPANFLMCPMIFQQTLDIKTPEKRFHTKFHYEQQNVPEFRVYLQGTKLIEKQIYTTEKCNMSNVGGSTHLVCWGRNLNSSNVRTMKGFIDIFFNSYFNGDYTVHGSMAPTEDNCKYVRKEHLEDRYQLTNFELLTTEADAIYMLHSQDDAHIFLWLSAAGFKPIPEDPSIMLVPLKAVILTDEGKDYSGFVTPFDSCRKRWFVLPDGKFVGQMDSSQTVRTQPQNP